ncbi:MAG: glycosyltransferase family 9 protein [Desulfovibrio sp.]|jgi:ADP-heptose:LPS heptosyltransferase|nr:glycosyltransferase family 9 protein [Desulfovibrio sp.]
MNILLLNLARFGDILQSRAAVADLIRKGHRVGMVCLENFAPAADLLPGLALVAPLPGAIFLACLKSPPDAAGINPGPNRAEEGSDAFPRPSRENWPRALAVLADFRRSIHAAFPPDIVCNLTPDASAKVLTRFLARGRACSGFFVDDYGFGVNGNAWAAFFVGSSLERGISPFNVVDLFRKIAAGDNACRGSASPERKRAPNSPPGDVSTNGSTHAPVIRSKPPPGGLSLRRPSAAARKSVSGLIKQAGVKEARAYVAFQPGASEDRRRWPVEYFAALGDILWREERLCPLILGGKSERSLAEAYSALAAHPHIDLCGRTDLPSLSAALCRTKLLVSNDTGTMHLAAGLKIPILAVFLATAQPFDTGPYYSGSCCLEPDLPCHPCAFGSRCAHEQRCARLIRPEFFASLVLSRLRGGDWILPPAGGADRARVWVTDFDAAGFMDLRSISGHEREQRTLWLALQRDLLRHFLDGRERRRTAPAPELGVEAKTLEAVKRALALTELLRQQFELAQRPAGASARQRLPGTWRRVYEALNSSPRLRALALLFAQECQGENENAATGLGGLDGPAQGVENFRLLLADFCRALEN